MNHGALAYIDKKGLLVPASLLKPLGVSEGCAMWGYYYPLDPHRVTSAHAQEPEVFARAASYEHVDPKYKHDILLTAVPHSRWRYSGILIVRLKHKSGALARVAVALEDQGLSIITAECTRSAHRFATWTMTVVVEDEAAREVPGAFEDKECVYAGTHKRLTWVQDLLNGDLKRNDPPQLSPVEDDLFVEAEDPSLKRAVEYRPLRELAFFSHLASRSGQDRSGHERLPPISFHVRGGVLVSDEPAWDRLCSILGGGSPLEPTCGFAEVDTEQSTMRVSVLPRRVLSGFSETKVDYTFISGRESPDRAPARRRSTKGLLAYITKNVIGEDVNLWRVFTQSYFHSEEQQRGTIHFFCDHSSAGINSREWEEQILVRLGSASGGLKERWEGLTIGPPQVVSLSPRYTRQTILHRGSYRGTNALVGLPDWEYDVFLSHTGNDYDKARDIAARLTAAGLEVALRANATTPGAWASNLMDDLSRSRALVVLVTPDSALRQWVWLEVGAALALGVTIVPIYDQMAEKDLPAILSGHQSSQLYYTDQWLALVKSAVRGPLG